MKLVVQLMMAPVNMNIQRYLFGNREGKLSRPKYVPKFNSKQQKQRRIDDDIYLMINDRVIEIILEQTIPDHY